ncbi:MAG TPA: hypothetical protein VIH05_05915 [Tepidiformaceae bacterium]
MGATTLNPNQTTTVSMTMVMHKGMDGPHLFEVTIPLSGSEEQLAMYVAADFQ